MNNRELFKEAIADAKAVKEAAIANAKAALEEAFTPFLREKLTQKLSEMEEDETYESENKMYEDEYAEDDAKPYLDEEGVDEYHENPDVATGYKKPGNIRGEEDYTDPEDMNGIDELNLDELLAELELEEEMSEGYSEEDLNEAKEEEEEETEEEEYEDVDADGIEDSDDKEIDITDMESLKSIIEDEIEKMIQSGELQAGPEYEAEEGEEMEMGNEMGDEMELDAEEEIDEDFSIDELLAELKKKSKKVMVKKVVKKEDETEKAKKELDEAIKVVRALKGELQEMKLFNAKLLYTNKIFKARNLNESQKVKVLSTFDKAGTIKEVELVYETLSSSFVTAKKQVVKESLGFASKPTGVSQKQVIVEEDAMVKRFKKLAGLI
jgi:hypothetical protein